MKRERERARGRERESQRERYRDEREVKRWQITGTDLRKMIQLRN